MLNVQTPHKEPAHFRQHIHPNKATTAGTMQSHICQAYIFSKKLQTFEILRSVYNYKYNFSTPTHWMFSRANCQLYLQTDHATSTNEPRSNARGRGGGELWELKITNGLFDQAHLENPYYGLSIVQNPQAISITEEKLSS